MQFQTLSDDVTYLSAQLQEHEQSGELIGNSTALKSVLFMIEKFKSVDVNVLITGESGTGKSLVARKLHDSNRRHRFVSVNSAAIAADHFDEIFFGCRKEHGNATYDQPGKLGYANGGTLYLDGIADMPLPFQAKLLGALQTQSFSTVGGRETHHFDARIIVSSNQDPNDLVNNGRLRQDLLYRLNAVEIHMPALRERREDIPLLCDYFIHSSSSLLAKPNRIKGITENALALLCSHDYPGNVRELRNTIEYAGIISNNEWIKPQDLPYKFTDKATMPSDNSEELFVGKTLQELERLAISSSYHRNDGHRAQMAAELGISLRGLWNKLKEYDIH